MSEQLKNRNYLEVEIYYFKKFLKKIAELLINSVIYFKKRFIIVAVAIIISIIYSYGFYVLNQSTYYSSHLFLRSTSVDNSILLQLLKNLNGTSSANISEKLKVDINTAANFISINAFEKYKKDSSLALNQKVNLDYIDVSVKISDSLSTKRIRNGIIKYLNTNVFVKKRYRINKDKHENMYRLISENLKLLETLKIDTSVSSFGVYSSKNSVSINQNLSALSIIDRILDLKKEGNIEDEKLKLLATVEVLDSYIVKTKTLNLENIINSNLKKFFFLSLLIILIIEIVKNPLFQKKK